MQNVMRLLFSFHGRIPRSTWWIATLSILLVELGYLAVTDPNYYWASVASLGSTVASLVFLVPYTAVIIKRCNDRGWPWWIGYVAQTPVLVFVVGDYLGYFADVENITYFQVGVFSSFILAFLYVLVDNGFLRGTVGANRYGPDPLEPSAPSPPQS